MSEENNYFLRITGSVNIPCALEVDHDYAFAGNISVYGTHAKSNQDGTQSVTFQAQFTDEVSLIKGSETVLAKSKLSQSQMFNKQCRDNGVDYERLMTYIRHPEIFQELVRRMEQV